MNSFAAKLSGLSREWIYGILIVVATVPFFMTCKMKNTPDDSVRDLYKVLMNLDPSKPIILESDWTTSTRGENGCHFEAAMRIIMRRKIKFVLYSGSDAQAPAVAQEIIDRINKEENAGYKRWENYLSIGFFPDLDSMGASMANDIRKAWSSKRALATDGTVRGIFESPVLKDVRKVNDFSSLFVITGTSSLDSLVERLSDKTTMVCMCTGVMGPQSFNYYAGAKQLKGLAIGLKGAYDMESLMAHGMNDPNDPETDKNEADPTVVPGFKVSGEQKNFDRASKNFPSLQFAMVLMMLAVAAGNLGLFLSRQSGGQK